MAGQKPQWKVLVSRQSEGSDKTYYTEIGSAWNVAKDGISVQLNATPIVNRRRTWPLEVTVTTHCSE